jgi:hypothetical protein
VHGVQEALRGRLAAVAARGVQERALVGALLSAGPLSACVPRPATDAACRQATCRRSARASPPQRPLAGSPPPPRWPSTAGSSARVCRSHGVTWTSSAPPPSPPAPRGVVHAAQRRRAAGRSGCAA